MLLRSLMFLVWAMVAASSVFWGMKIMAKPLAVPPGASVATPEAAAVGELSALLGVKPQAAAPTAEAAPPPPPESSRFQLIGVVAARHASRAQGLALIAVDGKAPRAYRVGAVVDGDLVLQSVLLRSAAIGPRGGAALVSLELPPLPPPATGVPGAVPPAMPGQPVPLAGQPSQPVLPPGMPSPPQLAMPPVPTFVPGAAPNVNLLPQARLRGQRFGSQPGNPALQGGAAPQQEDGQPVDPAAPVDHRSQR